MLDPDIVTMLANQTIDAYDGPILPFAMEIERLVREQLTVDTEGRITDLIQNYGAALIADSQSAQARQALLDLVVAYKVRQPRTVPPLHVSTVLSALAEPATVDDVAHSLHVLSRQVRTAINRLHHRREIHIDSWQLNLTGQMGALYVVGDGKDAPKVGA